MIVAIGRMFGRVDQSWSPVDTWVPCNARVLPEKKALAQVLRIPEVQITDLRSFRGNDAEKAPLRNVDAPGIARRDKDLCAFRRPFAEASPDHRCPARAGHQSDNRSPALPPAGVSVLGRRMLRCGWFHFGLPFLRIVTSCHLPELAKAASWFRTGDWPRQRGRPASSRPATPPQE